MSDEDISVSVDVNTDGSGSESHLQEDVDRHEKQLEQVGEKLKSVQSTLETLLEDKIDDLEDVNDTLQAEADALEKHREKPDTSESEDAADTDETNLGAFY